MMPNGFIKSEKCRRFDYIGACATAGGIKALRNFTDVKNYFPLVYASPQFILR
jgi:coenzyme F420-reducing hydrogenase gamma subunit